MQVSSKEESLEHHYNNLAKGLVNFCHRPAQKEMIAKIVEIFSGAAHNPSAAANGRNILAIEGPAGVGKSLAYLLAGIHLAKTYNKKLIISTATIALQEQLIQKDLPLILQHTLKSTTYTLAKGRRHYVCPYRLYEITKSTKIPLAMNFGEVLDKKLNPNDRENLQAMADAFYQRTWLGDLDKWFAPLSSSVLNRITNDRHGCQKNTCPNHAECPFLQARELLKKTDVIVVNHDLLLADCAMGGGIVLPSPTNSFYCIDEAHHFYKKAINQFSAQAGLKQSVHLLENIISFLPNLSSYTQKTTLDTIEKLHKGGTENLSHLLFFIEQTDELTAFADQTEPFWLFEKNSIPKSIEESAKNLAQLFQAIEQSLTVLLNDIELIAKETPKRVEKSMDALGVFLSYTHRIKTLWQLFDTQNPPEDKPIAKWISQKNDYWFCAAPTDISAHLTHTLWNKAAGILLTSATLRALGKFDTFFEQLGLEKLPHTTTLTLQSPFDFAKQAELYLPPIIPNPKNTVAHTEAIIQWLPKLIDPQKPVGTLVLFTSQRQMQAVERHLDNRWQSFLRVQGNLPKANLLKEHEKALANGDPSILFGLDSFAEGLDLPFEQCTQVIIAKLPFAVPNHPIDKTLSYWVSQKGRDPFWEIAMPEASLKLLQAVGRLLRTEKDYGRITILDNRLITQGYGKTLLATLPPFRRGQ